MIPECSCSACARCSLAIADHALALAFAFDDPALCRVSRTAVRLVSMLVDSRHGLASTRHLVRAYQADAAGGALLPLVDPLAIARTFVRSTTP